VAFPASIANDFARFDGRQTVAYHQLKGADRWQRHAGLTALRREVDRMMRDADGTTVPVRETVWHVPASAIPAGVIPGQYDQIEEADGTLWVVEEVILQTLNTRYRFTVGRVRK
jgi:hypothetical protein